MNIINQIASKNNGIVTSATIDEMGISRGSLKYLVDKGELEKSSRGVYILPGTWEDEFLSVQTRFKRGIFSRETALFLWDLTDRTPLRLSMTFPSTYNLSHAKKTEIICSQTNAKIYDMGKVSTVSPAGNKIFAYNKERTLCDILISRNHTDIQVISDAFKRFIKHNDKNIPLLSEYAKILKVEAKVRTYLEVLL